MSVSAGDIEQILAAAQNLVTAFGRHDTQAYFACFSPDASFVFYTHDKVLNSRAEYESLWASWERDFGFRVLSCQSRDPQVQIYRDVGIMRHNVTTHVRTLDGDQQIQERETIVFAKNRTGAWIGIHEHLSPMPAPNEDQA